jgi:hypothetical protein
MLESLHRLPTRSLRSLASSLSGGLLSAGITRYGIQQIAGADASGVEGDLQHLVAAGMTPQQMAIAVEGIAHARDSIPDSTRLFDLVLSGPDVPGVPTADTAAVVHTLIAQARNEVLLVGYAIHNGRRLFAPLANRMNEVPTLRVTFCIDISRTYGEATNEADIVKRFAVDFRTKHWPWSNLPRVFYDPRALGASGKQRASLHAKCIVVDREVALVTSANFTEAAQQRNIEAGVLVRHHDMVNRIADYFQGLISSAQLVPCHI